MSLRSYCSHQISNLCAQLRFLFVTVPKNRNISPANKEKLMFFHFYLYLHKYMQLSETVCFNETYLCLISCLIQKPARFLFFSQALLSHSPNLINFRYYPPYQKLLWSFADTHKRNSVVTHTCFSNA